ncbi:MAG: hypothetical protein ACOZIN_13815 [Myxococcota bacterium]
MHKTKEAGGGRWMGLIAMIGQQLVALISTARVLFKVVDRNKYIRPRRGAHRVVRHVGEVAARKSLTGRVTVEEMLRLQTEGEELQRVAEAASVLARGLGDAAFVAQSEAWSAALAYYSTLMAMIRLDPELEPALKPVVEFLAQGPRRGEEEPAAEAQPPVSPIPPNTVVE